LPVPDLSYDLELRSKKTFFYVRKAWMIICEKYSHFAQRPIRYLNAQRASLPITERTVSSAMLVVKRADLTSSNEDIGKRMPSPL
jgi:hypothetical protein